ncbi:MAG: LysE family transporter [Bacteroidetes bacterium]|nr:LysE family transporter [Bacteroidota bacterium]
MQENLDIWVYLLSGMTFGFAAAVQPGPLSLYLISQTLRSGWKRTLPAVFSPLITDGPIAVGCLFILSKLPVNLLLYLQIAGGLFILFLSSRAAKAWKNQKENLPVPEESSGQTLFNAVIVNFLNPGPYLGWSLIIGPLFLKGWKENQINGIIAVSGFYLTMFVTMIAILLLFHLARERGPRLQRTLIGLSAIALGLFGMYQLITGGISILR